MCVVLRDAPHWSVVADTAALRDDTDEAQQVIFAVSHSTAGQDNPVFVLDGEKGRVELGYEGWIRATWADGTTDTAEAEADTRPPGLLEDVVEAATGRRPALMCPLALARSQTLCACASFESSAIHPFPPALLRAEGEGGRIVVDGIDEAVRQAGEQGALFSELGLDWAVAGTQIDLAGYTYFPTFRRNVGA